ncbi:MAG: uracil-DNA glycosylase [Myxococcales bacterium]
MSLQKSAAVTRAALLATAGRVERAIACAPDNGYEGAVTRALDERTAVLREIRAHLEWEAQTGGIGIPQVTRSARSSTERGPAAERATGAPAATELPNTPMVASVSAPPQLVRDIGSPSIGDRRVRLAAISEEVRGCTRCDLAKGRTQTVFARGNPESPLVFVGEGPGQEEDLQGLPFVGAAGKLLDKMVAAMGYGREDVYICNVVKCRPPGNRTPLPSEAGACSPFLEEQLDLVAPRVIVALGRCAAENMGLVPAGGGWRGRWGMFRGVPVMPTYHPAFLLRSPEFKRPVWEDLQKVMARLRDTP